jgi:hypothetical protein
MDATQRLAPCLCLLRGCLGEFTIHHPSAAGVGQLQPRRTPIRIASKRTVELYKTKVRESLED